MRAEIIAIGDELTSGQRLDTNSQWLSERLGEIGIPVAFHTTVGDDLENNIAVFRTAIDRTEIVPIRSLPDFKSTESMAYPLVRLGRVVAASTPTGVSPGSTDPATSGQSGPFALVLLCDDLFETAIGAKCGGPAEDIAASGYGIGALLDRAEVAPGRWVSVYDAP